MGDARSEVHPPSVVERSMVGDTWGTDRSHCRVQAGDGGEDVALYGQSIYGGTGRGRSPYLLFVEKDIFRPLEGRMAHVQAGWRV